MVLIPYEKYQRLTSKSTSQQNAVHDVTESGGCKTPIENNRKLGPPRALVKPYDRLTETNTPVSAETIPTWITLCLFTTLKTLCVFSEYGVCIFILYMYVLKMCKLKKKKHCVCVYGLQLLCSFSMSLI